MVDAPVTPPKYEAGPIYANSSAAVVETESSPQDSRKPTAGARAHSRFRTALTHTRSLLAAAYCSRTSDGRSVSEASSPPDSAPWRRAGVCPRRGHGRVAPRHGRQARRAARRRRQRARGDAAPHGGAARQDGEDAAGRREGARGGARGRRAARQQQRHGA